MGLNGLLLHSFLAAGANHFLLVGDNFVTSRLSPVLRCSLHFVIATVLFYNGVPKFRDTYYHYLGLPITATHSDVLKSYDNIQEFLKNGAPEAVAKVKRAYEVLSNQETRLLYSLYGDLGIDAKTPLDFALIIITVSLSYYAIASILAFVTNKSNRLKYAKYACVLYNAVSFFLEIELRFFYSNFMRYVFYLNKLLPFQHIEFLRAMPPIVLMLSGLVSHFFVVDLEKLNMFLWQSTVATNSVILEKMANVVGATDHLRMMGRDFLKVSEVETKEEDKDSTVGDFVESLDENQKKKLLDLLNTPDGKDKKDKSKFVEMLKPFVFYLVMFFLIRFFTK